MRQKYYFYDSSLQAHFKMILRGFLTNDTPEFKLGAAYYVEDNNSRNGSIKYALFLHDFPSDVLNSHKFDFLFLNDAE